MEPGFSIADCSSVAMEGDSTAAASSSSVTIEEWNGSSSSKLSKTAVLTANHSSLSLHRFSLSLLNFPFFSVCFGPISGFLSFNSLMRFSL